jgi:YjbE family integral membrane protein
MTMAVVWLLRIPGLLAIGGALLVWIAWKLLIDNNGGEEHTLNPAAGFWAAMKTIIVADALMGLDNVLAVAGAAQGSFLLVVLGLLISIPIVIWGSQLILKFVERHPVIVYVGSGVLAWTAVKMVTSEPMLQEYFASMPGLTAVTYLVVIGGVLAAGFFANHAKVRARVAQHVVDLLPTPEAATTAPGIIRGGVAMNKVLLPVDGSANSIRAARHVINRFMTDHNIEVHVLNVRRPFSQHVARFSSRASRADYHREQAEKALEPVRSVLRRFSVPFTEHVELGEKAETITRIASELGVNEIVMGTARKNSITRLLEDSVTNRVLELTNVPVEIVAGESISKLERFGVPAGVGAALAVFVLTVD